jgi:hypothetical protein
VWPRADVSANWFSVVGDATSPDMNRELLEERRFDLGMVIPRHGVGAAAGELRLGTKSFEIPPA